MFIQPQLLAKAEILSANFIRDAQIDPRDDAVTNTVTWLIETFTVKRSLELALAIGRKIGGQHCIRGVTDDGSASYALIAEEPHQAGAEAKGTGITIFGRAQIAEIAQSLSGEREPRLQVGIAPSELDSRGHDTALIHLAGLLPWYRNALQLPTLPFDTQAIVTTSLQLGMPEALAKKK
jgi:hypothetical protein